MNKKKQLTLDKILTVICSVESGCLGPQGKDHVDKFCHFAKDKIFFPDANFISWEIYPRNDISLPEIQYSINKKSLSPEQATRYLALFGKSRDDFEDEMNEKLVSLIEQYFGR